MSENSNFKVTGEIFEINKIETGTNSQGKEYTKQEFVIQTIEKYPCKIAFTAMNKNVDQLSYYNIGSQITVNFKIDVSVHKGRNYNNLRVLGFSKD